MSGEAVEHARQGHDEVAGEHSEKVLKNLKQGN
jgi:hypothetical protein